MSVEVLFIDPFEHRIYLSVHMMHIKHVLPGLETYFFRNSQTFASGFNLNSQIAVSYSQLVLLLLQRLIHSTMNICWYVVYKLLMIKLQNKIKNYLKEIKEGKNTVVKIYLWQAKHMQINMLWSAKAVRLHEHHIQKYL